MCGRYTLTTDKDDLQSRFGFVDPQGILLEPRYNLAPSQNAPVVTNNGDIKILKMMRWGLVPFWADDIKLGYKMINARGETVHKRNSFKTPFRRRRCLVLADGFYEWKKTSKNKKIPFRFILKDKQPFAFAGLWDINKKVQEEPIETFTIITINANQIMSDIHDRMPVILHPDNEHIWLSPETNEAELKELLEPYPSDEMDYYEVRTIVNSPKNDTIDCIKPVH